MKSNVKKCRVTILMLMLLVLSLIFVIISAIQNVSAETNTQYIVYGKVHYTSSYSNGIGFSGDSEYNDYYANYFKLSVIDGSEYTETVNNPDKNAYNFQNITVEAEILSNNAPHVFGCPWEHKSAKIKDLTTNEIIYSESLSGTGKRTLFAGHLKDGTYSISYSAGGAVEGKSTRVTESFSGTFTIDTVSPQANLFANGEIIPDSTTVNVPIKFSASDLNLDKIYYKPPFSSEYLSLEQSEITIAPNAQNEGEWQFYATDRADNKSQVLTAEIDSTKPIGNFYIGESLIYEDEYINQSFCYRATDDNGIAYCQYKIGDGEWQPYTSGRIITSKASGWYTFRSRDKAGNFSDEIKLYYDVTAPKGTIYRENIQTGQGSSHNTAFVKFTATDDGAGIESCYCQGPGDATFYKYEQNSPLTDEGQYTFYAIDKCGNTSPYYSITIDRTAPVGNLFGDELIDNGAVIKDQSVRFEAKDNISIALKYYVNVPDSEKFIRYDGSRLTGEGLYRFYALDEAGNQSESMFVILDRTPPDCSLFAGDQKIESESYSNAEFISFSADDSLSSISNVYVRRNHQTDFELYSNGTKLENEGSYEFYAEDAAGNLSDIFLIVLDRTPPDYALFSGETILDSDSSVNSAYIAFRANDLLSGTPKLFVLMPGDQNFSTYIEGNQFTVEGQYRFYAIDAAGNRTNNISITLDRTNPTGMLFGGTAIVCNNEFSNAEYLTYSGDDNFGIKNLYVKIPGALDFDIFEQNTLFTDEGIYSFYCKDYASNRSDIITATLDRTAPDIILYADGLKIAAGEKTKSSYVSFAASDTLSGIDRVFVKMPSTIEFYEYRQGNKLTEEGVYTIYAMDKSGNQSENVTVTVSRTLPIGLIFAGSEAVDSDCFTTASYIRFSSEECISGISQMYVKMPSEIAFIPYDGSILTAEGEYRFKAVSGSGVESDEYRATIDRTAPTGILYAGTHKVSNDTITNAEYVSFTATDNFDINALFVKLPNENVFNRCTDETHFNRDGIYRFYAEDRAGTRSEVLTITLDKTKPEGKIYAENTPIGINSFTNAKYVYFTAADEVSGVKTILVKLPSGNDFIEYNVGDKISENGTIVWKIFDYAGNSSELYTATLDTIPPSGKIYANDTLKLNGDYTNLDRISFIAEDANLISCYVKTPNAWEWKTYTNGALYSESGRYEFYAADKAGNRSDIFVVIIDRTPKELMLNGVFDNKTDKNVTITWTNGNINKFAPVVSVFVNGIPYENGSALNTISGGYYFVQSEDAAGNIWMTEFVSERVNVKTKTVNKEWWEAPDADGQYYAFDSYENALAYAVLREQAFIRTGEWTNPDDWDTGVMMDAADSSNAKLGRFFIYKKFDDENLEVAYFTEERLNAVIRAYAENGIRHFYYFNGSPNAPAEGNDLYKLNTEGIFIADRIELSDRAQYFIDGVPFESSVYDTAGKHELLVKDDYGNEKSYTLIVAREFPRLQLSVGENAYTDADLSIYYLKKTAKLKISDEVDEYAMYTVKNANGEIMATLSLGEEYLVTESGKYVVQAVNHYGLSSEIQLYISLDAPTVLFNEDSAKKQMLVTIEPSKDEYAEIQSITIFKSIDGGITWVILTVDDYGAEISEKNLSYKFRTSGQYRVVVRDPFHTGFEASEASYSYSQPIPILQIHGTKNGGITNEPVSITWTDEAELFVYRNGEIVNYTSGAALTEDGIYELNFKNYDGFQDTLKFEIDVEAPEINISGAENGGSVNHDVSVDWTEEGLIAELYLNEALMGAYVKGTALSESGAYRIIVRDKAGNETIVAFTIDRTPPEAKLNGVANGGSTGGTVDIDEPSKEVEIAVFLNEEQIEYGFGETLSAFGHYRVVIKDLSGNETVYEFDIVETPNAGAIAILVVFIAVVIGIALSVFILRKRGKFGKRKKKKGAE